MVVVLLESTDSNFSFSCPRAVTHARNKAMNTTNNFGRKYFFCAVIFDTLLSRAKLLVDFHIQLAEYLVEFFRRIVINDDLPAAVPAILEFHPGTEMRC